MPIVDRGDGHWMSDTTPILLYPEADILWRKIFNPASGYNEDGHLPYGHAINVYGEGTP